MNEGNEKQIKGRVLFLAVSAVIAVAFSLLLYTLSIFPQNVDVFGHLFKINYLYESLKEGVLYPIYTPYWYNAMELFRYWPPLTYYVVALLQFCTGGDVVNAFYIFAGLTFFINMGAWYLLGKRENRPGIALLMGLLYFLCPDNMRVFMVEGNIPRIFIAALIPYVFYFVWEIIHYKRLKHLIGLWGIICIITFSHYMIAAMVGISVFVFCLIYAVMNRVWRPLIYVTIDLVCAYMSTGIMLLPGLTGGGITSQNSEASVSTINQWAQEAVKSLNPFIRFDASLNGSFYFGLSLFIIAVLGIIAANKKMGPGFITAVFIFLCTTTTASIVVRLLPLSQVFWMQRFVPMAMCLFFMSILLWKQLKKNAIIILSITIIIEILMTTYILVPFRNMPIEEIVETDVSHYLIPEAMELTENRICILDESEWGSIPSYYLSKDMDENSVLYSFGWAYQGAKTIDNIVSINEAFQKGFYGYTFDRVLDLGDDVILIDKTMIPVEDTAIMLAAAEQVGYRLYDENADVWLLRLQNAEGSFGTIKEYRNLAIGEHAQAICYIYPEFEYSNNPNLNEYDAEELKQYEKIYLSGFTYEDKELTEAMLTELADSGVQIYIDMQHIPLNKLSGKAEFMGVYAQFVAFTERFPILETDNGSQFKLDFGTAGYKVWNTVYLSGASENIKNSNYDIATKLTYLAGNGNPNITFMGFNVVYYYYETQMPELLTFLNEVIGETPGKTCESRIVPINVTYEGHQVTVEAPCDNVNTGIASLDCFVPEGDRRKTEKNNLLTVDGGTTVYKVEYTDFNLGMVVTIVGLIGSCIYWKLLMRRRKDGGKNEYVGNDDDMCCVTADAVECADHG